MTMNTRDHLQSCENLDNMKWILSQIQHKTLHIFDIKCGSAMMGRLNYSYIVVKTPDLATLLSKMSYHSAPP